MSTLLKFYGVKTIQNLKYDFFFNVIEVLMLTNIKKCVDVGTKQKKYCNRNKKMFKFVL